MSTISGVPLDEVYAGGHHGVLSFALDDGPVVQIVVVYIDYPKIGEHITLTGEWQDRGEFGRQFVVEMSDKAKAIFQLGV